MRDNIGKVTFLTVTKFYLLTEPEKDEVTDLVMVFGRGITILAEPLQIV